MPRSLLASMNRRELRFKLVEMLAERLMREFGVADRFEFSFFNRRGYCGLCTDPWKGKPGEIQLSKWYVERNPLEMIEDSLRHEIAHAMVGCEAGHNRKWRKACKVTGARPVEFAVGVRVTVKKPVPSARGRQKEAARAFGVVPEGELDSRD